LSLSLTGHGSSPALLVDLVQAEGSVQWRVAVPVHDSEVGAVSQQPGNGALFIGLRRIMERRAAVPIQRADVRAMFHERVHIPSLSPPGSMVQGYLALGPRSHVCPVADQDPGHFDVVVQIGTHMQRGQLPRHPPRPSPRRNHRHSRCPQERRRTPPPSRRCPGQRGNPAE